MSSSAHAQPESQGASSQDGAPLVLVRAGKTFVCTACGTLVEIPADVVGQLVLTPVAAPECESSQLPMPSQAAASSQQPLSPQDDAALPPMQDEPGLCPQRESEEPTAPFFGESSADGSSPTTAERTAIRPEKMRPQNPKPRKNGAYNTRPTRPRRPQHPQRTHDTCQTIDGLVVPSAEEWDRALAWVSFHRKVLKQQGSYQRELEKRLRSRAASSSPVSLPQKAARQTAQQPHAPKPPTDQAPMRASDSASPEAPIGHERGPP